MGCKHDAKPGYHKSSYRKKKSMTGCGCKCPECKRKLCMAFFAIATLLLILSALVLTK